MRIFVVGAGGFAREVIDIVEALAARGDELTIAAIHADGTSDSAELASRGYAVAGSVDQLPHPGPDDRFVIAFSNAAGRHRVDGMLRELGWQAAILVHPSATFGSDVSIAPGSIVCAGVRLTTNITLGRHVHVNLNSTIGHDAVLSDYVTVNPLVSVSGRVRIGPRSTIGTGASINEELSIGSDVMVGSGSVVIRDVETSSTVVGVPARVVSTRSG